jgi:hypothetical protein
MRWFWKYWPWLPPSRSEALALAVSMAFVAAFLVALTRFPMLGFHNDQGFGPGWDCIPTPQSEAVCVKSVPNAPLSRAEH